MAKAKKRAFHFNIGIISFLLIFLYILGHLILSITRDELAVYQVIQSQIYDSIRTTGIILRKETIVEAESDGYLNYYVNEGEVVSRQGLVYTCDKTGEANEYISHFLSQKTSLTVEDYDEIKHILNTFEDNYSDSDFEQVYDLKYDLENQAMKLGTGTLSEYMKEMEQKLGSDSFRKYYSQEHGIITYLEDGYENMTVEQLTGDDFGNADYERKNLKTGELVAKGDSVYRLTDNKEWQIVIPISEKEYDKIKERSKLTVNLNGDACRVTCPVEFVKQTEGYYAVLTMTNYLNEFVKDRYVEVEVEVRSEDGLKIPNSAIVEKEFYRIPASYLTGKYEAKKTLVIKNQDSKGNVTFTSLEVKLGKKEVDENDQIYYYVLKDDVPEHALISKADSTDTMLLKETVTLPGVYYINKGYADYRWVDILIENEDYTIVREKVTNSISNFDRIVLNGNTTTNNQIVY